MKTETLNPLQLRLRAEHAHDLSIISACMQDAIFPPSAMSYHADDRIFAILANRFMWEHDAEIHDGQEIYKRVHSGLYFSNVHKVRHWNIDQQDSLAHLNLLMIHGEREGEIHLVFAGQKQVCLHVEGILCHLKDLHEPWHTVLKPDHH